MQYSRSPIDQIRNDATSYISTNLFKPNEFNYQSTKIDHAYILQSYRRLRIQQRGELAKLRLPDDLKMKIFNFKENDDLRYEKPQLVIFNHPFRGKMVMTKAEALRQQQKQRKNVEVIQERQMRGQKVGQNIINDMGLMQESIELVKAQVPRTYQGERQKIKQQLFKPQYLPKKKPQQLPISMNLKEQEKRNENIYFINKTKQKEETQKQRTDRIKKLQKQKQQQLSEANKKRQRDESRLREQRSTSKQKQDKKIKRKQFQNKLKDIPIIGEQPRIIRQVKYHEQPKNRSHQKRQNSNNKKGLNVYSKSNNDSKNNSSSQNRKFFRSFGQQHQIKQFKKSNNFGQLQSIPSIQSIQQSMQSEKILNKKRLSPNKKTNNQKNQFGGENNFIYNHNQNKSISEISQIPSKSNYQKQESESNQSLNRALFLKDKSKK